MKYNHLEHKNENIWANVLVTKNDPLCYPFQIIFKFLRRLSKPIQR